MRILISFVFLILALSACERKVQSPCDSFGYKVNLGDFNETLKQITLSLETFGLTKYENDWPKPTFSMLFKDVNDKSRKVYFSNLSGDSNLVEVFIYSNDEIICNKLSSKVRKVFEIKGEQVQQ